MNVHWFKSDLQETLRVLGLGQRHAADGLLVCSIKARKWDFHTAQHDVIAIGQLSITNFLLVADVHAIVIKCSTRAEYSYF